MADLSFTYDISDASSVLSDASSAASDALSKATDALSKASVASVAAAGVASQASDASSAAVVAMSKASDASVAAAGVASQASDASSAAVVAMSKASDASVAAAAASDGASKGTVALSKTTARSAVWDEKTVVLKPHDETTTLSTSDDWMRFTVPNSLSGMNLTSCGAHVYTAATSGVITIDIYNITSAVDMLTSAMTIDSTEKDTNTATSAAVINTGADGVVTGEELRVDATQGSSGASGLEVRLTFKRP